MDNPVDLLESSNLDTRMGEIRAGLRQIQRRNWWSWWHTVVVVLLLTAAVLSLSLPSLLTEADTFFRFDLSQATRGLVGLVLLFNIYSLYQQIRIKRLCDELAAKDLSAETFRRLAIFDPLTGLYNRRLGEPRLATEVARAQRNGSPLTLLLLDLDRFKQINDQHGHAAGDLVLKEFAQHLNRAIRGSDVAVRMGGDEFMVLLPDCHGGEFRHVLERLGPFEVTWEGQRIPVAFSAGWKEYEPGERPEDLLEGADRVLYQHKRTSIAATNNSFEQVPPLVET